MRFKPNKWMLALSMAVLASATQAALIYSLAGNGRSIVRFDSAAPGAVTMVGAVSGAIGRLDGLDFRPADGLLYGYEANGSGIYRVDVLTGATTLVSTSSAPVGNAGLGIDFNPVADRLRIVNPGDENRRINVATGAAIADGALAFAAGDVNAGTNPQVHDAAYTNADNNAATATQLYYIDAGLDALLTTSNPNAGILNTVGALGLNTSNFLGFDIFTDLNGVNTAYASLRVGGVDGLYGINLLTGGATLIGSLGADQMFGLAVAPASVFLVGEPGALALLAAGGLAAFAVRRRKPDAAARATS